VCVRAVGGGWVKACWADGGLVGGGGGVCRVCVGGVIVRRLGIEVEGWARGTGCRGGGFLVRRGNGA